MKPGDHRFQTVPAQRFTFGETGIDDLGKDVDGNEEMEPSKKGAS